MLGAHRPAHMPEAPRPMAAVWLMHGNVCTALGKSWATIRPFSPPLPFPLIRVNVEQRMASLMDCWDEDNGRVTTQQWTCEHKCLKEDVGFSKKVLRGDLSQCSPALPG